MIEGAALKQFMFWTGVSILLMKMNLRYMKNNLEEIISTYVAARLTHSETYRLPNVFPVLTGIIMSKCPKITANCPHVRQGFAVWWQTPGMVTSSTASGDTFLTQVPLYHPTEQHSPPAGSTAGSATQRRWVPANGGERYIDGTRT